MQGVNYHPLCSNGGTISCIYPPNSISRYNQYLFFKNYTDSICQAITSLNKYEYLANDVVVFPNPSDGSAVTIQSDRIDRNGTRCQVTDLNGKRIEADINYHDHKLVIKFLSKNRGVFIVRIYNDNLFLAKKIIIQ